MPPLEMNENGRDLSLPGSTNPDSIEQGSEAKKTITTVVKLYNEYKKQRSKYDQNWNRYFDFYSGLQWPQRTPNQPPTINYCRVVVQTIAPILTDTYPGISIGPQNPSDYEFSQIIDKVLSHWWEHNTMDLSMVESVYDSLIYGTAFIKVIWDPDKEDGIGDIDVQLVDPRDIFVPENARDFTKNCPCVIHRSYKPVGEIKRLFPQFKDVIKADSTGSKSTENQYTAGITSFNLVSPVDQHAPFTRPLIYSEPTEQETCEVLECWMDSDEIEMIEIMDEETQQMEQTEKLKYPMGKVVTILPNQQLLLQEVANPYSDGKKPFARLVNHQLPRRFLGEGEIEPLYEIQKDFNRLHANILKQINLISNPVWILEKGCGVDAKQVTNQIAQVLTINKGSNVRREAAPPVDPRLFELEAIMMRYMDTIAGTHDITQGRRPKGITAGIAIDQLQEAAQTRIRLKERNMQSFLQNMGELLVSRVLQFYREPRIVKITEAQSPWPKFFEFHIEEEASPQGPMYSIIKSESTYVPGSNSYVKTAPTQSAPSRGMFDITVQTGTSLPYNKQQRASLSLQLYDKGAIDKIELLNSLDYPGKDKIIQRMANEDPSNMKGPQAMPGSTPVVPGKP